MRNNHFLSLAIIITILFINASTLLQIAIIPKQLQQLSINDIALLLNTASTPSYLIGHFEYYNRKSEEFLPLAFVAVSLYIYGGDKLGTTYTDINGNFTFGPIDVSQDGMNIICYVYTQNDNVIVLKGTTSNTYSDYTWPPIFIQPGENKTITATFYDPEGGFTVFSYHSGLIKGWHYIYETTSSDILNATARYPYPYGIPHYDSETREIHLPTFTYNYTDTILHEYAHYVMHWAHYYSLHYWYWPGSSPDYSHNGTSDPTTAWVEGWAFFFPLAVKNNGTYIKRVWDYDEVIDFENQHWCSPGWDDGDKVVGRVTGALWDIYDSQNDSYDTFSDGFNRTWNVLLSQPYNGEPCNNFFLFWKIWNVTYYTHPKTNASQLQDWNRTLVAIFQNSIDYRGPGDVNVDGLVDMEDLYYVAIRFGVSKGDSMWDDRADLNHDDFIDIEDLYTISLNYGKSYDC